MTPQPAPTREFFHEHFIKPQTWTTTDDCIDYRLVRNGDELLIVFQQSNGFTNYNGLKDWVRNLRAWPEWSHYWKAFIHKGFLKGWKGCHIELYYSYTSGSCIPTGIKEIQIIGYSQGCGIGLLEYAFLMQQKKCGNYLLKNIDIKPPIFFAPPRLVWCLFSWRMRKYLKNARLIRAPGDVITHQPSCLLGYRHIGKPEYLTKPAGYVPDCSIPAWIRATHHNPEYYLACLPSEKEIRS